MPREPLPAGSHALGGASALSYASTVHEAVNFDGLPTCGRVDGWIRRVTGVKSGSLVVRGHERLGAIRVVGVNPSPIHGMSKRLGTMAVGCRDQPGAPAYSWES